MIVTSFFVAVLLTFAAEGCPCIVQTSPTYVTPINPLEASAQTVASRPACFNPRQALYERWPLLYQVYAQKCRFFCNKLNGVTPCPSAPVALPVAGPAVGAPPPVRAPVPVVEECPACAATASNPVRPEVLSFLYGSSTPNCPCCAQQ